MNNFNSLTKIAYITTISNYTSGSDMKGFPLLDDDGNVKVESPLQKYQRVERAVE